MSVVIHEVSHGYMADILGDPTARKQGRLSLNPLKHLDPVGSIIIPLITSLAGFTFGWAKPVPYNPYNLKNMRMGEFLISLAGPMSNLILALVFGVIIRLSNIDTSALSAFVIVCSYIVVINIVLTIFNLIPLPPLDGSKILFSILPHQYGRFRMVLEKYSTIFILVVVFFLWQIISPIIPFLFHLITGVGFM
jgi:Zn-dependent protease